MKRVTTLLVGLLAVGCGLITRNPDGDEPMSGSAGEGATSSGTPSSDPNGCDAAPIACDGGCPTPDELEAQYADYCERFPGARVRRSATTCGGSRLYAARTGSAILYCFDEQGRLVGNSTIPDVGVTTTNGVTCIAAGDETTLCQ